MSANTSGKPDKSRRPPTAAIVISLVILAAGVAWSYWTTFALMSDKWAHDPQYSHGYLVPLFAAVLLWIRRGQFDPAQLRPSWWGLPILAGGALLRVAGSMYYLEWFDHLSILPVLFGICLLLGGWHALRWSWPAIAFLFFMIPLPYTLEVALRGPLRRIGTVAGTYLMQTIGLPAVAEGNVIVVEDHRIGVVEACSGLRMLMVFFALSTAVAMLSERKTWEKIVIVLSAVPIALISNIARITVTGVLHLLVSSEIANLVFHDLAGWLMMVLGLLLLGLELWLLTHLFIEEVDRPMAMEMQLAAGAASTAADDEKRRASR